MRGYKFAAITFGMLLFAVVSFCSFSASTEETNPPVPWNNPPAACDRPTTDKSCFTADKILDRIVYCTNNGKYYLFLNKGVAPLDEYCISTQYSRGNFNPPGFDDSFLAATFSAPGAAVCPNNDLRAATSEIVAQVLQDPRLRPGRSPIGFIGAIFCDQLQVVGYDLTRSLVFDHSVFLHDVLIRNFTTALNLSFNRVRAAKTITVIRTHMGVGLFGNDADIHALKIEESVIDRSSDFGGSLVSDLLTVALTKINGNLQLDNTIINHLDMHDSEVGANLILKEAAIMAAARVDRSKIQGALDATDAAFSLLQARYNNFATNVELSSSEFRCGLDFSKNQVGSDLFLLKSTLGRTVAPPPIAGAENNWSERRTNEIRERIKDWADHGRTHSAVDSSSLIKSLSGANCQFDGAAAFPSEARINDNRVDKNVCIESFGFRAVLPSTVAAPTQPESGHPSYLSLNGTNVTGNSFCPYGRMMTLHRAPIALSPIW